MLQPFSPCQRSLPPAARQHPPVQLLLQLWGLHDGVRWHWGGRSCPRRLAPGLKGKIWNRARWAQPSGGLAGLPGEGKVTSRAKGALPGGRSGHQVAREPMPHSTSPQPHVKCSPPSAPPGPRAATYQAFFESEERPRCYRSLLLSKHPSLRSGGQLLPQPWDS